MYQAELIIVKSTKTVSDICSEKVQLWVFGLVDLSIHKQDQCPIQVWTVLDLNMYKNQQYV